jgi:hypothetical protein
MMNKACLQADAMGCLQLDTGPRLISETPTHINIRQARSRDAQLKGFNGPMALPAWSISAILLGQSVYSKAVEVVPYQAKKVLVL